MAAGLILVAFVLSDTAAGQLGARPAEEWIKTLESPERVAGLRIDEVIGRLRLKPGDVIADLGAGSGLFAFPLAKAVGSGRVYAVELDDGFLTHIRGKAKAERVANVVPVLGKPTDPSLPARNVDVAFLHDVLHHVENRQAYLKNAAGYVERDGRIVVIEFNPAQSPHRDQPELIVTREQTTAWLADVGFVLDEDIDLFADKWFVVYRRR